MNKPDIPLISQSNYSTFSKDSLLRLLKEAYAFDNPDLVYLKRGFNDTYKVTSGSARFILRIYRYNRRTLEEIRTEVKLLLFLGKHGVSVSLPIPGKDDVFIHPLPAPEGMRYAVLFSFAEGEMIRKPLPEQCRWAGESLGFMHSSLQSFTPGPMTWNYAPEILLEFVQSSVHKSLVSFPDAQKCLDSMQSDLLRRLSGFSFPSGICHGDLQSENFYFQQDHKVCFIDFDFAGYGPFLYDLGAYTWYDHQGKTPEMLAAFYEGYSSVIPLNREEKELIPLFGGLRALFLMGMWNRFNDGETNPEWNAEQIAAFVWKVKNWISKRS